jgi:DNA-binding winged helix-turn-helix (wHTH) protein
MTDIWEGLSGRFMDNIRLSKNIILDCLNTSLIIDQKIVSLDNLEFQVLKYLVEHKDIVVTKEELLSLWPSTVVMDHSLARVLSIVRKKLGDSSKKSRFIKTLNRQGYLYVGLNSAVNANDIELLQSKSRVSLISSTIVAVILLLGLYFSNILLDIDNTKQVIYRTEIIVDPEIQKQDLSINQNGVQLAYSARILGQEFWFLRIKDLRTNRQVDHRIDNTNISSPIWLDNQTIVFQSRSFEECEIKKMYLLASGELSAAVTIDSCNISSTNQAMATLTENQLVIANTSLTNALSVLDITTGAKSALVSASNQDSEIYFIQTSPDRNYLATLSTSNWFSTIIKLYHVSDFDNEVWQKEVKNILYTVALSNTHLTHVNEYGGMSEQNILSEKIAPLNAVFTSTIYSPLTHSNDIFLLEGLYSSTNVALVNISTSNVKEITHFNGVNVSLPKQVNNDNFIFVSNQSGKNQIWLASFDDEIAKQLSVFERSYNISSIDVDTSLNRIALTTQFGVVMLNKDNAGQYQEVISIPNAELPVIHEGSLFYTKSHAEGTDIYQYDLLTNSEQLYIKDGYKLIKDAGYLYYIKYFQTGIWQRSFSDGDRFFSTPFGHLTLERWNVHNGILYLLIENQLAKYDLDKSLVIPFENIQCSEPDIWLESSCIFIQETSNANRIVRISRQSTIREK